MSGSQVANRCFQLNAALKIPSAKILPVHVVEMFEEFASCHNVTYLQRWLRTNLFNGL